MTKHYVLLFTLLCMSLVYGQDYTPKNDGVKTERNATTVFTNAKIYVTPTQIIENGTLVIKNDKVQAVGTSVTIPKDAIVFDLNGKWIYPSFIDVYSNFGITKPKRNFTRGQGPQYDANRQGYYWNDHIRPEVKASEKLSYDNSKASDLLKLGFGVVNTHMPDGIARGTGALVALNNSGNDASRILSERSALHFSTSKSALSRQSYPNSLMGAMALLRQVAHDANWYAKGLAKQTDKSLAAYNNNKNLPQIIEASNKLNVLRMDNVGDDMGLQFTIVAGGDEYERIDAIKATNATLIVPLNFPDAYDVENPFASSALDLAELKEWNQKPSNPKALADANITFALTPYRLKSKDDFLKKVDKAITYGLSPTKALEALTTVPAQILRQNNIGHLNNGAQANFFITDGDIFNSNTTLFEHWVQGDRNSFRNLNKPDIRGSYQVTLNGKPHDIEIKGSLNKPKAEAKQGDFKLGAKVKQSNEWMTITLTEADTTKQHFVRLVADAKHANFAKAIFNNGNSQTVAFKKTKDFTPKAETKKATETTKVLPVTYPNIAYGFTSLPQQETLLFKNATVWTNEKEGILKQTDVLIKNGKIAKIGTNLSAGSATVIDATGKHLTSGIIDEHSHIATDAVNEGGQNSSAEVTIEDVVNPEDISIYRNLAGGVTAIQILHGSANPIGGRSAIIKLKWGETPENVFFKERPKFIKFALGENVKQSNWGDLNTVRFPQTRMGVEQVYMDYFSRAKAYDQLKKSGKPYRKDLELETLAEIINKERFISCHSYVQSEINMLMKVAERFNFNVNTFTHILEGYKVADKMKTHGAAGSTFSDWWAYKYEVNDAIPYNAAIMHNQGVLTAINSDDAEMSRRLNQEAAKTMKYGGVSEEDAWKFVTLNPAKMLHIDDRVGSIKVGKDADVVLWSDHPLSVYSKAEKTIIEGKVYFDIERDKQLRKQLKAQKTALINDMLKAKNKGLKTQAITKKEKEYAHCDTE